jgi:hypothetical protein
MEPIASKFVVVRLLALNSEMKQQCSHHMKETRTVSHDTYFPNRCQQGAPAKRHISTLCGRQVIWNGAAQRNG